jgi:redox-regulated HSP33 family molecular chaperone
MSGRALDAKRTVALSMWVAGGLSVAILLLSSTLAANKLLTVTVRGGSRSNLL